MKSIIQAIVLWVGMLLSGPVLAQFNVLHTFTGGATDGIGPNGSLILSGSTLYGMTNSGGTAGSGTVFKINTNGTGFSLLHSFAGGTTDGSNPYDSLTLSGSTLYGMTQTGGTANSGTIFKIGTDGTGFGLLQSFTGTGGAAPGSTPHGSLIIDGSTLYGMTSAGGSSNKGTVFQVGTNGSGYSVVHTFTGGTTDGSGPNGSLIQSGTTLYGMTSAGGNFSNDGTVFKVETSGSGFGLLYTFTGSLSPTDGRTPQGSLLLSGTTLYGMTNRGNIFDEGTVFKIGTNGTGYNRLKSFTTSSDGMFPNGSLIQSGSSLYGMTTGNFGCCLGTVFKMATDGTTYNVIHTFDLASGGGYGPFGSLIQSGSTFYGMTRGGTGSGTIFALTFPISGDYNTDGAVNAGDYVIWRKTDGSAAGYNAWRTNFGKASGSGSIAIGSIPEPASLALTAACLVGGVLSIRCRKKC
jgi:uncharacterized repeat protein (TIGR03803 family)